MQTIGKDSNVQRFPEAGFFLRSPRTCAGGDDRQGLISIAQYFGSVVLLNVLRCRLTYQGQTETNA